MTRRGAQLCASFARSNASLAPRIVLRYAVITTVAASEGLHDFVASGLSAEEELRLTNCQPDGYMLFEHLLDQEAPLRLDDFPAHLRSLVGVVVFDARMAEPAILNREARRTVEALGLPGSCEVDMPGEVTSRPSDGREVTLEALKNTERLRGA